MKQLLAFAALLAVGYALGNRRARKRGPVDMLSVAVEVDASQATAALKALQAQAVHAAKALELVPCQRGCCSRSHEVTFSLSGHELTSLLTLETDRLGRVAGR